MSGEDIFLSYASEDRNRIIPLVNALRSMGWTVFWDTTIRTGTTFRQAIEEEMRGARAVIVVWSRASVASIWVQSEADSGFEKGCLCPVSIERVKPPRPYDQIQTANLAQWDGSSSAAPFQALVKDLRAVLGEPPSAAAARKAQEARRQLAEEATRRAKEEERQLGEAAAARREADEAARKTKATERLEAEKATAARRDKENKRRQAEEAARKKEAARQEAEEGAAPRRADDQGLQGAYAEAARRSRRRLRTAIWSQLAFAAAAVFAASFVTDERPTEEHLPFAVFEVGVLCLGWVIVNWLPAVDRLAVIHFILSMSVIVAPVLGILLLVCFSYLLEVFSLYWTPRDHRLFLAFMFYPVNVAILASGCYMLRRLARVDPEGPLSCAPTSRAR